VTYATASFNYFDICVGNSIKKGQGDPNVTAQFADKPSRGQSSPAD